MTISISVFPQTMVDELDFSAGEVSFENENAVKLKFSSLEYNDEEKKANYKVENEFTLFCLNAPTAECLSIVGRLDKTYRAKLVPILRDMLAEQELEKEDA